MVMKLQRAAGNRRVAALLRQVAPPTDGGAATETGPAAWLQGDGAQSDFLDRAQLAACEAASHELAGTPWTADRCPWIIHWIDYYRVREPDELAAALERYAPEAAHAASPEEALQAVAQRIRAGIRSWRETGEISTPGQSGGAVPSARTLARTPSGAAAAAQRGDPHDVRHELGDGRALDSSVRSRMERA